MALQHELLDWLDLMSPGKAVCKSPANSKSQPSRDPSPLCGRKLKQLYKASPLHSPKLKRKRKNIKCLSCPRIAFHEKREKHFIRMRGNLVLHDCESMELVQDDSALPKLKRSNSCPSLKEPAVIHCVVPVSRDAPVPILRRGSSVGKNILGDFCSKLHY